MRAVLLVIAWLALCAVGVAAQVGDSARVGPTARLRGTVDTLPPRPDSLARRPPISPTRALLESFVVPGWGQASLHRSTAGGIFAALEFTSIAMLIQSKKELNAARNAARDSVFNDAQGVYVPNPLAGRIPPRKQAVEDWTALLIATHLFAGADAFVAAELWDVPVEVHGQSDGRQAYVSVRVPF